MVGLQNQIGGNIQVHDVESYDLGDITDNLEYE